MQTVKFTYFPVWAKGPSIALALELSGMPWEGAFPTDWAALKPTTTWGSLPTLEIPGVGTIGHESTILNWIGSKVPALAGESEAEFLISQQLMSVAEDLYKQLGNIKNNVWPKDKQEAFWLPTGESAPARDFGLNQFLQMLDGFYNKCNAGDGKFTSSGHTVGEIKLFTMLHAVKMIKQEALAPYAGLAAFHTRFAAEPQAQSVIQTGAKMPGPFDQYFVETGKDA